MISFIDQEFRMVRRQGAATNICLSCLIISITIFFVSSSTFAFTASEVVDKYCQLDLGGARLSTSNNYQQILSLMAWHKDQAEPGWDCFLIISGYSIQNKVIQKNTAAVTVKYDILAISCSDYVKIEKNISTEILDFELVNINQTWKIKKYVVRPRVSIDTVVMHYKRLIKNLEKNEEANHKKISNLKSLISQAQKLKNGL